MRKLKFRAWEKVEKKMLFDADPFALHVSGSNEPLLAETHRNEDCIFEQYTGLKDKNGKEIYDGDIIDFFGEKYPVIYRAGGFWAEYSKTQKDHLFLYAIDSEVIGNIHENPELLEAKNVD